MRIAIIGNKNEYYFEWHFKYTLKKLNHQVCIFDGKDALFNKICPNQVVEMFKRGSRTFENKYYSKLVKSVIRYQPELIVVCYKNIPPYIIGLLKKKLNNAKIIHINSDAMITMSIARQYVLCSPYDAWFTKDPVQLDFMKNILDLNVLYLPEAFNPDFHKPSENQNIEYDCDVIIIANIYPYKSMILERLHKELDVEMVIHGDIYNWIDTDLRKINKRVLWGKEKAEKFYSSKICLNTFHYAEVNSVNCRFFEIIGSGGFQICDDKPIVYEFLEKDKEIVTFKSYGELKKKIIYYLEHPGEREEIRKSAYEKFKTKHTYEKRIEYIFKMLGVNGLEE